jgi:hypothetical protein
MFKFEDRYKANRQELSSKLSARYGLTINLNIMADLILYNKIETRGFLVYDERGNKLCRENLILHGEIATQKS